MIKQLFFCLILIAVTVKAQDNTDFRRIDSLNVELSKVKTDTARLSILLNLGVGYARTINIKTLEINEEAAKLARKLNQPYKEALSIKNTAYYYDFSGDNLNWKGSVEKIIQLGEQTKNDEILGMGNYEMALYYWKYDPPKSEEYFEKSVNYYKKTGNKDQLYSVFIQYGFYFQNIYHDYNKALSYYREAGDLMDKGNFRLGTVYNAMGTIYSELGQHDKVLEYEILEKELYENNKKTDNRLYYTLLSRMGGTYKELKDYDKALEYFSLFYDFSIKKENHYFTSISLVNMAEVYLKIKDEDNFVKTVGQAEKSIIKVYSRHQRSLIYNDVGDLFTEKTDYPNALKFHLKAYKEYSDSELDDVLLSSVNLGAVYLNLAKHPEQSAPGIPTEKSVLLENSKKYLTQSIAAANSLSNLSYYATANNLLSEVYDLQGDKSRALAHLKTYYTFKDSIKNMENRELLVQNQMQFEFEQKEKIQKAEQDVKDALNREELNKERNRRNLALGGVGVFLLVSGFVGYAYSLKKRDNKIISREKQKSEDLLLNILPEEIAQELKEKSVSEPRYYESVTIIFTDFEGFTKLSEKMSSKELIHELNYCFKAFDEIITKYGIEKIKTIGDSYMAVCGLPKKTDRHAKKVILAAFEMRDFIEKHKEERKSEGKTYFEMRIGINTGEVVAGIVGIKKFAYDIWGDAVNTASRMESNGKTGRVNVSETTRALVKDDFCFEYRGKIETKGKGEIEMYFVEPKSGNSRFEELKEFILNEQASNFSPKLTYHNVDHVLDVHDAAVRYAELEKVSPEDLELLKIAALFHDSGYMVRAEGHEEISCEIAEKYLPGYGYTPDEIQKIKGMIRATKIPQSPKTHLEEILADADLDYLGRDDFDKTAHKLFTEFKLKNDKLTPEEWDKIQVSFFEKHHYFTQSAIKLRNEKKNGNLEKIRKRIAQSGYSLENEV